jgi:cardiolipin synthase
LHQISIPNILTLLRILLTPLLVIFLLKDMNLAALCVFIIAGVSDGLDGFIARFFNQRTELGAFLDPIADKLLLMSSFIVLAILGIVPGWLTVIVLSRDILIVTGIIIIKLFDIQVKIRPSMISKCTTVVQLLTVLIILIEPNFHHLTLTKQIFYWATAILTTSSGLHYMYLGMGILHAAPENGEQP